MVWVGSFDVSCRREDGGYIPEPGGWPQYSSETGYIAPSMSFEDRQKLRAGALKFARSVVSMRYSPVHEKAARHMDHFLNGKGKDIILSASDVEELENFIVGGKGGASAPISQLREAFKKSARDDFISRMRNNLKGQYSQAYMSWNKTTNSCWFGASAPAGTSQK